MSATAFQRMRREQEAKKLVVKSPKPIDQMTATELKALAKGKGIKGYDNMKKAYLISALSQVDGQEPDKEPDKGGGKEPDKGGGTNDSTGEGKDKTGDGTE